MTVHAPGMRGALLGVDIIRVASDPARVAGVISEHKASWAAEPLVCVNDALEVEQALALLGAWAGREVKERAEELGHDVTVLLDRTATDFTKHLLTHGPPT